MPRRTVERTIAAPELATARVKTAYLAGVEGLRHDELDEDGEPSLGRGVSDSGRHGATQGQNGLERPRLRTTERIVSISSSVLAARTFMN